MTPTPLTCAASQALFLLLALALSGCGASPTASARVSPPSDPSEGTGAAPEAAFEADLEAAPEGALEPASGPVSEAAADTAPRAAVEAPEPERPETSGTCVGKPSRVERKHVKSKALCCYTPPSYFMTRVREKNDALRACYDAALQRHPDARGRVVTKFIIEEDGSVDRACDAGSTVGDPEMVACVLRVFTTLAFDAYTAGNPCPPPTIVYPLQFKPGS